MSLFRVVEWVSHLIPNATTIVNARFFEDREQLIVGGEDGQISVIDAGSKEYQNSILFSYQTKYPILQIEVGEFLSSMTNILAVLCPTKLIFYRINFEKKDESSVLMEEIFAHSLEISAWNMCQIKTAHSSPQLLIQTIDCKLSLYEGDQCVFAHCALRSLHPGPLGYSQLSSSLLTANNGFLNSVKFSLLSSGSQKKINYDWSFNLGDTAIQMELFETSHTSIIVLCRRHVSCFNSAGNIRWQIRLESVGTAMHVYKNILVSDYSTIRLIIATNDENLLIYNEDHLVWNCTAQLKAISLKVCSYNKIYENVITLLSNDGKIVIGYLGTEPNLYKVPTDTKIVNFAEKLENLKMLEQKIRESETSSGGVLKKKKGIQIDLSIGEKGKRTIEHNARNNVPFCNVSAVIQNLFETTKLQINILSEFATPNKQIVVNLGKDQDSTTINIPFYIGADKIPTNCTATIAVHCFHTQASCIQSINLPIDIFVFECTADRNAKYRITLDTDSSVIPINKLFSELKADNPQSIGLQVYGFECSLSIFAANKSNRYRVQSEQLFLLQFGCDELMKRIREIIPNIQFGTSLPFEYISEIVDAIHTEETKKKEDEKIIDCRMKEVRAIEALSLNMSKSGNMISLNHLDALFDKSYRELLDSMDQYTEKSKTISTYLSTLGSLFQLLSDLSKINKIDTIINGYFYTHTQQPLRDRLLWAARVERGNEIKMIEKLCEHSQKELPKIKEEEEEEEEEEENKTKS